ncbi:PilZ domain-containing protein [Mesorhizobium sp. M2D.F.Ca.ET.185.01.1.1]|uniref:PilZ domain-containing protein n=1 Tax=unclassified Mesorhizobium TaxID=325217 RepID=UPI000FCB3925|nr:MULTISPECIES: PilZ domain-containing protein [unclassified Mesorhizobium]TGP57344.1 PilZ domain-containing protein [bacterium M00.F.Ca.ET.230.01.1.1]TGP77134.1 PilZ domain-containing protein [bacterium M00.F.Ca.ET.227.01.1.1]TGP84504.1 PilZ domain-containing protein [bacterium M00.F.Ca.ET.221.01.1.1]TGP88651.1 PilZ domain-containing protein [bacterium M00.F.Ca.ET.222.01.1.1]TGT70807.1 PilZ domain-containing protein [bacterium M00.F.Ca.ET.159.01.1.1]TGT82450.1 PilZ domain-containing protein
MAEYPEIERRLRVREFVLKEATIIANGVRIGCSVRNQHEQGAELRVAADAKIPERFLLEVPADDTAYRALVRWRRNDRVGVALYSNTLKD